jgi:hypothetical protein
MIATASIFEYSQIFIAFIYNFHGFQIKPSDY